MTAGLERHDGRLRTLVYSSPEELGAASAQDFAEMVHRSLLTRPTVSVILASANSQLPFLRAVRAREDIPWGRVQVLHMDEYLGMPDDHPASFRRFLLEELINRVRPLNFHPLCGDATDPDAELARYSALLEELEPDICVLGIGENGHLAFNDPPADFATRRLVHVVTLDDACRRQQWQEGHFPSMEAVPTRALSLTVHALLRPRHVLAVVPERRKARAVKAALSGDVSRDCPASILRTVPNARLYLDPDSAALLD